MRKRPAMQESEWGLDEIMKCCRRFWGHGQSVYFAEQGLMLADDAIKMLWAALKKNHPIQAAITLACAKRRNQYAETDEWARKEVLRDEIMRLTTWLPEDEWRKAVRLGLEIRPLPTEERKLEFATLMVNSGFPEGAILPILKAVQRETGRPPSKRVLFVSALEAKLVRPDLSWEQLFRQLRMFQPPGQKPSSAGSIFKGVGELRRELIKYHVELPPPWSRIELICQEGKNPQH
jgi:hypothetical protein